MAKFEEENVINALHTEKAEIGKKYWVSDQLADLKKEVENARTPYELKDVKKDNLYPFMTDPIPYQFLYPYEEPPKQRMTSVQLMEWLAKGNGMIKGISGYVHCFYGESEDSLDKELDETFLIRPFGQTDWIEPTVDIYERDCKKEN